MAPTIASPPMNNTRPANSRVPLSDPVVAKASGRVWDGAAGAGAGVRGGSVTCLAAGGVAAGGTNTGVEPRGDATIGSAADATDEAAVVLGVAAPRTAAGAVVGGVVATGVVVSGVVVAGLVVDVVVGAGVVVEGITVDVVVVGSTFAVLVTTRVWSWPLGKGTASNAESMGDPLSVSLTVQPAPGSIS